MSRTESKSSDQSDGPFQPATERSNADAEAELLECRELVAEIIKWKARPESPSPWWHRILQSTAAAALITVLIGGIFGQYISNEIQKSQKDRENKLTAYNKLLEQGHETINRAYALIGNCIAVSDDLITMQKHEFDHFNDQKEGFRREFTAVDKQWRAERIQLGLLMGYYHHNDQNVTSAWQTVQETTTAFLDCANEVDAKKDRSLNPCQSQKQAVMNALDRINYAAF